MIDDNEFVGSIPTEVGLLTNILYLDLSENKFEGSIPSELGLLTRLWTLDLGMYKQNKVITKRLNQLNTKFQMFTKISVLFSCYLNRWQCTHIYRSKWNSTAGRIVWN